MIKVCHIITMLELGGAQRNTLFTMANLDRNRFQPVLVCGPGGILDPETHELEGVKTYFVPELVRPISPVKDIICVFRLYKILSREKPFIVHTHSSKAGILGRIAARLAGVPVVIHTFHGFGFHGSQDIFTKTIYVLAEFITGLMTTKFVAVAKEDITKGVKHGIGREQKYVLIRSGIDTSKYAGAKMDARAVKKELGIAENAKVVTTIGPFKPQKNLTDLVKVCALVAEAMPEARYLVVGDGEQRLLVESLIKKLGLSDKILLLGWRLDVERILAVTDVFAMTSLWEGLPRSILEAMCAGVPVVANAVDGVKEIVKDGETGYLMVPGDVQGAAEKIVSLLKDPVAAKGMGNNAKTLIDAEFDINNMVKQQENLYTELAGKEVHV